MKTVAAASFTTIYQPPPNPLTDTPAFAEATIDDRPAMKISFTVPNDLTQTDIINHVPQNVVQNDLMGHPILSDNNFTESDLDALLAVTQFNGLMIRKDS